jgi:AraC-like DNA-binding protein
MDVHKNARSVPASRALLFKRVSEHGWSVLEASEAAGMSDRRCREWIRRARADEPLTDRSSQPRTAKSIAAAVRTTIVTLRRERRTMRQVAQIAGVSTSTVARICRAEGLRRLRSLEPPPPPIRYERERPGELLHIDTKRLGRFDRPGHRITRERSFGSPRQGFEFVFVATDDASRLCFGRIYRDERSDVAARFLNEAVAWFSRRQVVVERVMTDNGSPFLGRAFRNACAALQIKHKRTPTLHPADQRQSRTLHPDPATRMGLQVRVRQHGRAQAMAGALHSLLQLPPSPLFARRSSTHQSPG